MTDEQIKREARRLGVSPAALRAVLEGPIEEAREREQERLAQAELEEQKRESRRARSMTSERGIRAAVRNAFRKFPMSWEEKK